MKRQTGLSLLQRHRAELVELGVESLSIVGSTAREEARASSDVDVVVRLTEGAPGEFLIEKSEALPRQNQELFAARWWRGLDSNQRRRSQRIYSPSPLATRAPLLEHHSFTLGQRGPQMKSPRAFRRRGMRFMVSGPLDVKWKSARMRPAATHPNPIA